MCTIRILLLLAAATTCAVVSGFTPSPLFAGLRPQRVGCRSYVPSAIAYAETDATTADGIPASISVDKKLKELPKMKKKNSNRRRKSNKKSGGESVSKKVNGVETLSDSVAVALPPKKKKKNGKAQKKKKNPTKKGDSNKPAKKGKRNPTKKGDRSNNNPKAATETNTSTTDKQQQTTKPKVVGGNNRKKNSKLPRGKPLKSLKLGSTISGPVTILTPFGAFVKTDYAIRGSHYGCALLHISKIQEERIDNISDVLKIGQNIENARVISIDYEKGEVGISLRTKRPARKGLNEFKVGMELEGKVTSVASYGAFVDVGCKSNALLHISRITQDKVENVRDYCDVGQVVKCHVIDVDEERKTMAVSMLDKTADEYLDWRQLRQNRKRAAKEIRLGKETEMVMLRTQLDFVEETIKDLEETFKVKEKDEEEQFGKEQLVGGWDQKNDGSP